MNGTEQEIIVDNQYITNKIITPSLTTVVDYQAGLMTPYADILSNEDINNIIEYISTLK